MLLKMDLKKYQHKRVLELSGGNKRKLRYYNMSEYFLFYSVALFLQCGNCYDW